MNPTWNCGNLIDFYQQAETKDRNLKRISYEEENQ